MRPNLQTQYIVDALRDAGAMYEDDARQFLAEHDHHVRTKALAEAKAEVIAWLVKKAHEDTPVSRLANKVDRGAIRLFSDAERHSATARQTALLIAIGNDPAGRWKSGRAITVLRGLGYHPISPGTASRDLAALADRGHLVRHDEPGCTWYEPTEATR